MKKVLTYNIKSRKFKKDIARKVDSLSPSQTDKLVVLAKKRIYDFEKERLEQARRNLAKARSYRNQLLRRRNGSGFRPVITTLNSGVALGAGAVVGPDGRTVRLSLNPFFSELGPVDTFNFFTGETRRIYTPPRQRRRRPIQYNYDGIRTRASRPSLGNNSNNRRTPTTTTRSRGGGRVRNRAIIRSRVRR